MALYSSKSSRGFLEDGVHLLLPSDAKPITAEKHRELLQAEATGKVIDWSVEPPVAIDPSPRPAAELAETKRTAINAYAQRAASAITDKYPPFEITTFEAQEREARAWLADQSADTPNLSLIAMRRGIELTDLANRVIQKADLFRPFTADLMGRRQALEDQLDAIDLESTDAVHLIAAIDETQLLNPGVTGLAD
jgi:hypothetical protein